MLLANNLLVVGNNLALQTWLCSNANRKGSKRVVQKLVRDVMAAVSIC